MTKKREISQKNFDKLLDWLDKDREIAGQKYEKIRSRLIKIFNARGCFTAEESADETIDRVVRKISDLKKNYEGEPALYFYAVGKNVLSEFFRKPVPEELSPKIILKDNFEDDSEILKCLKNCLQTLTKEQHSLIINYYDKTKHTKIEQRKKLAERMGVTSEILRIKVFRLKSSLQKCVERCLEKKNL
jgi:DNA-directed RNA polymerase specialized sigma24 family protein